MVLGALVFSGACGVPVVADAAAARAKPVILDDAGLAAVAAGLDLPASINRTVIETVSIVDGEVTRERTVVTQPANADDLMAALPPGLQELLGAPPTTRRGVDDGDVVARLQDRLALFDGLSLDLAGFEAGIRDFGLQELVSPTFDLSSLQAVVTARLQQVAGLIRRIDLE